MFDLDKSGKTILHHLVKDDQNVDQVIQLLSKTPEIVHVIDKSGETTLHIAARSGSFLCLQELVKVGVDLDIQSRGKLDTALILAACHGNTDCAKFLLNSAADVTLQTRQGFTAEDWARKSNHFQIENLLKLYNICE